MPPVDPQHVTAAVTALWAEVRAHGTAGAAVVSDDCFTAFDRSPNWQRLDYCIAFDDAAAELAAGMTRLLGGPPLSDYFSTKECAKRARAAVARLTRDSAHAAPRLAGINGLAVNALGSASGVN